MKITKFRIKLINLVHWCIETDSNVSFFSPETSVELLEVSVDFSERNASVSKTRNFELLCMMVDT
jgi:hypothetical protein